jgi:hypothetical protein
MRWKRIGLAGLLAPALAGCHVCCPDARDLLAEKLTVCGEAAVTHELRQDAKCAWREVRTQYPRRMFSEEFRDGFLDGYTDYLDRGGSATLPAVPPAYLTRNKKYYTPEGQARLKDYFLGFQYGMDVAIATGCRQFLTVPVLLPQKEPCAPAFAVQPGGVPAAVVVPERPPAVVVPADPRPSAPSPLGPPKPLTETPRPMPGPEATGPKPPLTVAAADPNRSKFGPLAPRRPGSDVGLPPQNPPLPIPFKPMPTSAVVDPAAAPDSKFGAPAVSVKLPAPPPEVPTLPEGVPTPPVRDDLPVLAPNHGMPPALPANHAPPGK